MKKVLLCLLIFAALCLALTNFIFDKNTAFAYAPTDLKMGTKADSCVLADYDSATIIYQRNAQSKRPIASITKLMTLIVAYDSINSGKGSLDDLVTISANAADMGGSQAFLDANSRHRMSDLLKLIIVCSANDASVAVAEHLYGSVETFVSKMNKKASELGLVATNFVNCTGLPALNQYSCAIDCVKMLSYLIRQKNNYFDYSKIWLEDYVHPNGRVTTITNTNKLVRFYSGCDGGKTGFTNEAMHCLCATAKRGETRLIACVLAEPDSKTRFAEVSEMLNFGFANYQNKVYLDFDGINNADIKGGKQDTLKVAPVKKLCTFTEKGQDDNTVKVVIDIKSVKAPVKQNDIIGKAYLVKNDKVISETDILALETVEAKTYFDNIGDILRQW